MNRWHGRHPIPWDFFYSFNDVADRNLNWFWNNWFFSNNYIDYSLTDVSRKGDGYNIAIHNTGGMFAPFDLVISYTDGTVETLHQTPIVWKDGLRSIVIRKKTKKKIKNVRIDNGIFMDTDLNDNLYILSK